jgi:hypothetical protein
MHFHNDIETNFTGTTGGLSPYLVRLIAVSFDCGKRIFLAIGYRSSAAIGSLSPSGIDITDMLR